MIPRYRVLLAAALAVGGVVSAAKAQGTTGIPSAGSAAGSAAGLPPNITIQTAAQPQAKTIWNCLGISSAGCAALKQRLCNSQVGQLLNNGMAPLSGLSGGLIPQFCPTTLSPSDLDKLKNDPNASPAVKQAEAIKAEEAQAKARVAAVEYLGTVDCRRYPEAKEALIKALRNDNNECVRYAAARVLINGCCCSKKIVAALTITVMGPAAYDPVKQVTPDTFPVETSERVRCAAMMALQGCLANPDCIIDDEKRDDLPPAIKPGGEIVPPTSPDPKKTGDKVPETSTGSLSKSDEVRQAAYHAALARKPMSAVVRDAQRVLDLVGTQEPTLMTPGNRTLSSVVARSRTTTKPARITAQAPRIAPTNASPIPLQELAPEPLPRRAAPAVPAPAPRTPAFIPTPTSVPSRESEIRLPRAEDDEDDLPPLPPVVPTGPSAATTPAPAVEPVSPATYKPVAQVRPATPAKPRKVVRLAPEPAPAANPLIDRFSRTPESFRGDIQR